MMKKYNKIYYLLILSFLILSCNIDGGSDVSELNKKLDSIKDNQKTILRKMETIEKKQSGILAAVNNPKKDNKKQQPPEADPNKVYNIPIGDSFVLGNPNASVTIIEWMDFQ